LFCGKARHLLLDGLNDSLVCFRHNVLKDTTGCDFYRIRANRIEIDFSSPVFPEGFRPIPVAEIGIKSSAHY